MVLEERMVEEIVCLGKIVLSRIVVKVGCTWVFKYVDRRTVMELAQRRKAQSYKKTSNEVALEMYRIRCRN